MVMKFLITFLLLGSFFLSPLNGISQDARLAQSYYQDGEFEKAATLYQQLFEQNEDNDYYLDRFIESLLNLERYSEAEEVLKKQIRQQPDNVKLYVTYGKLYEYQFEDEKAQKLYQRAIEALPRDQYMITKLANAFTVENKYELAIQTFERGIELLRDEQVFAYNLGDLYRRKGEAEPMINYYLNSLDANPERMRNLRTIFQRYLLEEDFAELKKQLYTRIQEKPEAAYYPELLTWVFLQEKDYRGALRQVRALDRRYQENGGRIFQLGQIASGDGDFETAIQAYDYIVEEKGRSSSFYLDAKREALRNRRLKLVEGFDYTETELRELEQQYNEFLDEFGRNKASASIILELAELEAYYLNDLDAAVALLQKLIQYPNINPRLLAEGKINLGDFFLMKGNRWESTLLYSQVDKEFKEDQLGHEARFRNARLSYYTGDFQWAQAQFDVLKASTSKLIANDALDLSVFIMDNLGLDSTATALEMYATADLLVFQNRFEEAFARMDSLLVLFPQHSLQDDVLYLKARVYEKRREFDQAAQAYLQIVEKFPDDIRADNSLYRLAELYETQLSDTEKAQELYERVFLDYSSSTLAVEARKKYRLLRGDEI